MCKAFSCLITKDKKVIWKLGIDSHDKLIDIAGFEDSHDLKKFIRAEITPKNNNYFFPDDWKFKIDSEFIPRWFSPVHKELCFDAHKKWLKQLDKILRRKKIIDPFKDIKPVKKVTKEHIELLKEWNSVWNSVGDPAWYPVWDSVRDSVGDSVRNSVWDSVWDSVGYPVRNSVWDSVGDSVWNSVWDSVWAYMGSFFKIDKWKYIEHEKGKYPFNSAVKLWESGLVPSFNGEIWRLHTGKKAKIIFEISKDKLRAFKEA